MVYCFNLCWMHVWGSKPWRAKEEKNGATYWNSRLDLTKFSNTHKTNPEQVRPRRCRCHRTYRSYTLGSGIVVNLCIHVSTEIQKTIIHDLKTKKYKGTHLTGKLTGEGEYPFTITLNHDYSSVQNSAALYPVCTFSCHSVSRTGWKKMSWTRYKSNRDIDTNKITWGSLCIYCYWSLRKQRGCWMNDIPTAFYGGNVRKGEFYTRKVQEACSVSFRNETLHASRHRGSVSSIYARFDWVISHVMLQYMTLIYFIHLLSLMPVEHMGPFFKSIFWKGPPATMTLSSLSQWRPPNSFTGW